MKNKILDSIYLNIAISIIGILLIIITIFLKNQISVNSLTAIGGAFLGLGISEIINYPKRKSILNQILKVVRDNSSARIISNEESINIYKSSKFCLYYVTFSENGERFWNSHEIDFTQSITPGTLKTKVVVRDFQNYKHQYIFEAFKKKSNSPLIIFILSDKSEEREGLMVFPFAGKNYMEANCGFTFLEAWNSKNSLTPCILSTKRLVKSAKSDGRITLENEVHKLEEKWKKESRISIELL